MERFLLILLISVSSVWAEKPATPNATSASAFGGGEGVMGQVNAMVIQKDGRVVIGGAFTSVNGVPRWNIARLNADGTLDETFANTSTLGVTGQVFALAIEPDGRLVAGGLFTQSGRSETQNLLRYNVDGTVDASFGQPLGGQATNGTVLAVACQPNGKILIGGQFSMVYGQERRGVARLKADGTVDDLKVGDNILNGTVHALASAPTSEVLAGGSFSASGKDGMGLLQLKTPLSP